MASRIAEAAGRAGTRQSPIALYRHDGPRWRRAAQTPAADLKLWLPSFDFLFLVAFLVAAVSANLTAAFFVSAGLQPPPPPQVILSTFDLQKKARAAIRSQVEAEFQKQSSNEGSRNTPP